MSNENIAVKVENCPVEDLKDFGAEMMADEVIRLLDAHIKAVSNLDTIEALKKVRKSVSKMKKYASLGDMESVTKVW